MLYRDLGNSRIRASVIAFGAWAIGGFKWGGADERVSTEAIHCALDEGINLFDTAPVYGMGESERVLGRALKGRRDKAVIIDKCGVIWHQERGVFNYVATLPQIGTVNVYKCLHPDSIRYEIETSLKRLQTDYIDLYMTHWPDSTTRVEDTMETLLRIREEGKIRAIGCCNVTPALMEQYEALGALDADQELFSMIDREKAAPNLEHARKRQMAFLAYSPMGQGLLTGRMSPERVLPPDDQRSTRARFSMESRKKIQELLASFAPYLEKYGCTCAQLVMAWTMRQPGCSHLLAGSRTPEQVRENARSAGIMLTNEELAAMDRLIEEYTKGLPSWSQKID